MDSDHEKVDVKFDLPFQPYPNQLVFMKDAYECFEKSRFGLFESPTGSGKTLSILCSSLTWLKNNRLKTAMCNLNFDTSEAETVPKWVTENAANQRKQMAEEMLREETTQLENLRKKVSERIENCEGVIKLRKGYKRQLSDPDESETRENSRNQSRTQFIICSRTFSQLNQYVKEFRKLDNLNNNVRLSIGCGRTHVCINNGVKNKCKNSEELNEECRRTKCEYRSNTDDLSDITTCYPLDLEDLVRLGKDMNSCPYYSNLSVTTKADIILAPYVTIINDSLRESLGIRIKDSIIIFDEGHNLIDAITEAHSCKMTLESLKELLHQIKGYSTKYRDHLKGGVVGERISQITKFTTLIVDNLSKVSSSDHFKINTFTVMCGLEELQFHEILNFMSSTDFCRHLRGWAEREYHAKKKDNETLVSHTSMIYTLKNFIHSLLYCDTNDQVIVTHSDEGVEVEIFPLASEEFFHKIVEESKAVLVMSGTLSPIEEFLSLVPQTREPLIHRSPPVFPLDRFFTTILDKDSQGEELVFDFSRRENEKELQYLCQLMELLSEVVPNGIVCFFSSYSYLNAFYTYFLKSPSNSKVMTNKCIFKEQKNVNIFPEYSKKCMDKGAVLFAVFGGSQSEGVDFSDGLARLVLLVGIPYPPDNVKLMLKREYYQKKANESSNESIRQNYLKLSQDQRTILCYKKINQCIGRAMRHRGDYSAVVLLDSRYRSREANEYLTNYVKKSILMNEKVKVNDLRVMLQKFYTRLS